MNSDTEIKISLESKLVNLPLLRKMIRGLCSNFIYEEQVFQDIELSLNEALSNIINHAYKQEPGHEIQIIVTIYPTEVVFQIIDVGEKILEIASLIPQDASLEDIDSISEQGRGLFLIHQLMDKVDYTRKNDKNILILRKCFKKN